MVNREPFLVTLMSDTVELLVPLDAIAWLFRHAPEAFTGAQVFHAQTEMVGPVTEHHLAGVAAARRPAIRAAVEKGKGPFLDEQPIHSHLVLNPSGLFLIWSGVAAGMWCPNRPGFGLAPAEQPDADDDGDDQPGVITAATFTCER